MREKRKWIEQKKPDQKRLRERERKREREREKERKRVRVRERDREGEQITAQAVRSTQQSAESNLNPESSTHT